MSPPSAVKATPTEIFPAARRMTKSVTNLGRGRSKAVYKHVAPRKLPIRTQFRRLRIMSASGAHAKVNVNGNSASAEIPPMVPMGIPSRCSRKGIATIVNG